MKTKQVKKIKERHEICNFKNIHEIKKLKKNQKKKKIVIVCMRLTTQNSDYNDSDFYNTQQHIQSECI